MLYMVHSFLTTAPRFFLHFPWQRLLVFLVTNLMGSLMVKPKALILNVSSYLSERIGDASYFTKNNEASFQKDIKRVLKSLGYYVIKMAASGLENQTIDPDLLCLAKKSEPNKASFFLECKRTRIVNGRKIKTKEQPIQAASNNRLQLYIAVYVTPDWESFKEALQDLELLDL